MASSDGTAPRTEAPIVLGWRPLGKRAFTDILRSAAGLELVVVQGLRGRVLRGQVVNIVVPPERAKYVAQALRAAGLDVVIDD